MRSDDKLEFLKLMVGIFAAGDVPSNDDSLVHQIHIVTDFLSQVREEMDVYFKIAPKVERYFDLWDSEKENRRNPKYVEDAVTGELVLESQLVESTFCKIEKEVWSKVAAFRGPPLPSRLLQFSLEPCNG